MRFSTSPYARALGQRMDDLHPALRAYFSGVAPGQVGVGEGTFERVGTRRRWLNPFLRPLQRRGVLVAGWHTGVPFRVENRIEAGRAVAERILQLPGGPWVMRDSVALTPQGRLVDAIGRPALATATASFDVQASGGTMRLRSRAVGLRIGPLRLRIPAVLSPVVRLREAHDAATGAQRVDVTIDAPIIGRVYEYGGTFTYRIEEDAR
ncbi:DUF4166 domain-containing protein [Microbacterium bovistercoris]|uniref:DUF4166 domain-containing protein n=1 Tax=Microbacterium bovistercoris TaxID=2293570 RepID=A0A371NR59_9MICO|nr:DUF4166 domain-containing protein [Microbacterium bovistercoris]REJ04237.1 DUF4166 domain-containing protein [Microbacterium bovistercoris]